MSDSGHTNTREIDDMLSAFAAIDDTDKMYALMQDLFTIREIKEISQRLAVAKRLDAGESYMSVQKSTGVSATTISRVSKCLNYGAGGYKVALDALKKTTTSGAADSAAGESHEAAGRASALRGTNIDQR